MTSQSLRTEDPPTSAPPRAGLVGVLVLLSSYRWSILAAGLSGLLLAGAVLSAIKPSYVAAATVFLHPLDPTRSPDTSASMPGGSRVVRVPPELLGPDEGTRIRLRRKLFARDMVHGAFEV